MYLGVIPAIRSLPYVRCGHEPYCLRADRMRSAKARSSLYVIFMLFVSPATTAMEDSGIYEKTTEQSSVGKKAGSERARRKASAMTPCLNPCGVCTFLKLLLFGILHILPSLSTSTIVSVAGTAASTASYVCKASRQSFIILSVTSGRTQSWKSSRSLLSL